MQKSLLEALLKAKTNGKKSVKELIEGFIQETKKTSSKELKEVLSSLLVFIDQNHELDEDSLKKLVQNRIKDTQVNFKAKELESIYASLALASFPQAKMGFVFDKVDIDAIEAMRKSFYWAQQEYNKNFQNRLKDIMEDTYKGKLPRVGLATKLREEFSDLFKHDARYFEGVADHIISQNQNIARVNQAAKYGVQYYKVVAVIDTRTSPICRSMNGRIIEAKHLTNQTKNILEASSMAEKKAAATWRSEPFFGKNLPKNFGLPPYHFRCRTEVEPVWVEEEEIDGKMMRYADKNKDDELVHIDKTGVQRRLKKSNTHIFEKHKIPKKDIISALNSIEEVAPKKGHEQRTVTKSKNGYFLVFDADELVTIYKPTSKLDKHFKKNANTDKKEIIKWTNMKSISIKTLIGR